MNTQSSLDSGGECCRMLFWWRGCQGLNTNPQIPSLMLWPLGHVNPIKISNDHSHPSQRSLNYYWSFVQGPKFWSQMKNLKLKCLLEASLMSFCEQLKMIVQFFAFLVQITVLSPTLNMESMDSLKRFLKFSYNKWFATLISYDIDTAKVSWPCSVL